MSLSHLQSQHDPIALGTQELSCRSNDCKAMLVFSLLADGEAALQAMAISPPSTPFP